MRSGARREERPLRRAQFREKRERMREFGDRALNHVVKRLDVFARGFLVVPAKIFIKVVDIALCEVVDYNAV
jgi:hypothetical protein